MSQSVKPLLIQTYIAEAAVIKFEAVMAGTSNEEVKPATGAGVVPVGVCMAVAAAGEPVEVVTFGPFTCIAAGAIVRGALVEIANTDGEVDDFTVTAGGGTVKYVVGTALNSAAADQDHISIFVGLNQYCQTT